MSEIHTAITAGNGSAIHWGSDCGTICGAGFRNGRKAQFKAAKGAVTCKRCVKIMAAQVEEAHAEALAADEKRSIVRAALSVDSGDVVSWTGIERAYAAYITGRDADDAEALEIAEITAFEQDEYDHQLAVTADAQWSAEWVSSLRRTLLSRDWAPSVLTSRTPPAHRYYTLLRKHAAVLPSVRVVHPGWTQDVNLAHSEALEQAEMVAFEQNLYNGLRSGGWSHEDAVEMSEGARVPGVPWSEPTAATRRYDELLARHAGTLPRFTVRAA